MTGMVDSCPVKAIIKQLNREPNNCLGCGAPRWTQENNLQVVRRLNDLSQFALDTDLYHEYPECWTRPRITILRNGYCKFCRPKMKSGRRDDGTR